MFQARLGTNGKQYMVRVGVADIQWLQICPLYMFGNKATDGSKYWKLQGLALIQGQIYNPDILCFRYIFVDTCKIFEISGTE